MPLTIKYQLTDCKSVVMLAIYVEYPPDDFLVELKHALEIKTINKMKCFSQLLYVMVVYQ